MTLSKKWTFDLKSIMILTFYLAFAITMALIFPLNSDSVSSNIKIQYSYAQESGENQTTFSNNNDSSNISKLALPKLFSQVRNSVVQVSFTADIEAPGLRTGLGSGFVYDDSGHILTNYHVISPSVISGASGDENADILVTFQNGSIYEARLVGSDPFSDIAVLRIENISESNLAPLPFGNSSQLEIGEQAVAIGNPFGLSGTMTEGIISGLGRTIPASEVPRIPGDEQRQQQRPELQIPPFGSPFDREIPDFPIQEESLTFSIPGIIQTDAAVNPGNSGGPLLNMKGQVIGMNTAIFSTTGVYSGVGFAIPANTIAKVVPSLIATGSYQHPWLGISGVDITPDIARALGLGLEGAKGFLVIGVNEGSPADRAGIQGGDRVANINGREIQLGGDIIVGIDNQTVRQIDDILTYLERETQVGDTVQINVIREGIPQTIDITLAPRPGTSQPQQRISEQPSLGISGTDLTPVIARAMNLTQDTGFLVVDVIAGGPADKAGIRGGYVLADINGTEIEIGGDVIIGIDNTTVSSIDDILSYLDTKNVGDTVQLNVLRNGERQTIDVNLLPASTFERERLQTTPESPQERQPGIPDEQDRSPLPDSSEGLFGDFYNRCIELLGRQICDPLFSR